MGIDKGKRLPAVGSELRRHAEDRLRSVQDPAEPSLSNEASQRLIHELQVHQVELEMQNEEIRRAWDERDRMETLLGKYSDLYDFAPVGYFNLDRSGIIHAVNFTGAKSLGVERSALVNRRLDLYISDETRPVFHDFLDKVFASETKEKCELVFLRGGHSPFMVQIEAVVSETGDECRAVGVDITDRRQAENALKFLNAELEKANETLQAEVIERKKAEDALRFSEGRYRVLFRENPTMIVILDADLTVLSVNPACYVQLGYATDELEGRSALVLFHEDDRPAVAEQLWMCLQNPVQVFHWQFRKICKDGSLLWVEETAQAVYDANGMLNVLVVCQDVTERRRMVEELRESEERFRATFSQAPVGIGHVTPDGRLLRINRKYCEIVGYTEEEIKGLNIEKITHPDDLETSKQHYRLLLEGKLGRYSLEKRYIRKDGTIVWVNLTISMVYDTGGHPKFAVGIVEDITARRQAEEELKRSETRFRRLFESAKDGIMILGMNTGQIIDANPSLLAMLGYSHEELMGMILWEIGAFSDIAARKECFTKLRQEASISYEDLPLLTKDGRQLYVEFVSNVYQVDGTEVIQCNIRDISYRKFAEQEINKLNNDLAARAAELESANFELEAFNYSVAHDLRNPLNVISSYCQVFKELCGDKLDEQCLHYIDETYNGTLRMNRLIESLLNFSRLAHAELKRDMVDLSSLAKEAARELGVTETARRVTFRIGDGINAHGDANLLRVVLANLFGNAWKYTAIRDEGIIEFGTKEIDGKPAYFVRDNGTGFDNADAGKIFTPFKRLPDADKCRGFGIGLATVERIIRHHEGKIWAEGEPGKGATFYFTLSA